MATYNVDINLLSFAARLVTVFHLGSHACTNYQMIIIQIFFYCSITQLFRNVIVCNNAILPDSLCFFLTVSFSLSLSGYFDFIAHSYSPSSAVQLIASSYTHRFTLCQPACFVIFFFCVFVFDFLYVHLCK